MHPHPYPRHSLLSHRLGTPPGHRNLHSRLQRRALHDPRPRGLLAVHGDPHLQAHLQGVHHRRRRRGPPDPRSVGATEAAGEAYRRARRRGRGRLDADWRRDTAGVPAESGADGAAVG